MGISILGCGWMGLPLAVSLIKKGYYVKGSTTTSEKMALLKDKQILPFVITVNTTVISGNMSEFLDGSELLIINIPPGMRNNSEEKFSKKIAKLLPYIENSSIQKVILVSSTTVYGMASGIITEATTPQPITSSAKELIAAEDLLRGSTTRFATTVIRFGGLVGKDRHPVKFLSGKKNLANPKGNINFIHQDDCIGLIKAVINKNYFGKTINGVYPHHPERATYYTEMAKQFSIEPPQFDATSPSETRKILSLYVESELGYRLKKSV